MDRSARERRTPRRAFASLAILGLLIGMFTVFMPASGAEAAPCKVTNLKTKHVYAGTGSNLQTAINAAKTGVTLQVQGICKGNFTISQSINLKGLTSQGDDRDDRRKATLDGKALGTVLTVNGGTVSLLDLKITNGNRDGTGFGGGIVNSATLILDGSTAVTGNTADGGGGIYNPTGDLTMKRRSSVSGNSAEAFGGGIYLSGGSLLTMNGQATVANNESRSQAMGGIFASGDVIMNGRSSVKGNTSPHDAGGLFVVNNFTMNDFSSVKGNTAANDGGGIWSQGTVTMNDSSVISGNTAGHDGGGISNLNALTMNDSSTISYNTANDVGGGIYSFFATLNGAVDGTNVYSNTPDNIFTVP